MRMQWQPGAAGRQDQHSKLVHLHIPVLGMRDGVYDGVVDGRRLGDDGGDGVHVGRQQVGVPGGGWGGAGGGGTRGGT